MKSILQVFYSRVELNVKYFYCSIRSLQCIVLEENEKKKDCVAPL